MTTTKAAAALTELADRAKGYNCTPAAAGEPIRSASKVIAGRLAQVKVIGWEQRIVVELDKSTEPLSIEQAAERIAG